MATLLVKPSQIQGVITPPPSKSQTVRALLFAALAKGRSRIERPLLSADTVKLCSALQKLGCTVAVEETSITVEGKGGNWVGVQEPLDLGNSGIALRFLSALASLSDARIVLTGDSSLRERPMTPLLNALEQLGATVASRGGRAPVEIKGPIKSGITTVEGAESQPISALLMAIPFAQGNYTLDVSSPGEKPWVDLTLHWLDRLQLLYKRKGYHTYWIEGGQSCSCFNYRVPADLSSAAFPAAGALITQSKLTFDGMDWEDPQGDRLFFSILESMGAHCKDGPLQGATIDVNNCIDALPILAAIACYAKGTTTLVNGAIARTKECNRLRCTAEELTKMGASIEEHETGLTIHGTALKGATVSSHGDHRLAMTLAMAALGASSKTTIQDSGCIAKTWPTFVADFQRLGAEIEQHT